MHAQPNYRLGGGANDWPEHAWPKDSPPFLKSGAVMVVLLVMNYRLDCAVGIGVALAQVAELRFKVTQDYALNSDGCGRNRWSATQSGNQPEDVASGAAKMIATAPANSTAPKLFGKYVAMVLFVASEHIQLSPQC
jgi:hypothetical protein